jgi:hypothetical protein
MFRQDGKATCSFGTRVAPPISSTAEISSTFKFEILMTSFRGTRAWSHKSPHNSSNFSRVIVLLVLLIKKITYENLKSWSHHNIGGYWPKCSVKISDKYAIKPAPDKLLLFIKPCMLLC